MAVCLMTSSTAADYTGNPYLCPDVWSSFRNRRDAVDLHNGEFCVDVSTFGLVEFKRTARQKCDTIFEKKCETKSDQVT